MCEWWLAERGMGKRGSREASSLTPNISSKYPPILNSFLILLSLYPFFFSPSIYPQSTPVWPHAVYQNYFWYCCQQPHVPKSVQWVGLLCPHLVSLSITFDHNLRGHITLDVSLCWSFSSLSGWALPPVTPLGSVWLLKLVLSLSSLPGWFYTRLQLPVSHLHSVVLDTSSPVCSQLNSSPFCQICPFFNKWDYHSSNCLS